MKKGILYFLFLLSFGVLQAQTGFEAKSLIVDTTFDANTFDPVGKGKVCNTGTDTICLLWRIEEDMVPLGWTPYFCDNNLCYGPGTEMCPDDNPVCLGPDECGVMDLHLLPGANPVCGKYNVVVWEQGDTSNYLVISYQFNCAPSSTHDAAYEDVKVFPNPTASYFEVSDELNLSGITVHNLLGKVVRSFNVHEGGRYDVSGLSNGMYVVNLIGDNNRAVKSVRLRKE